MFIDIHDERYESTLTSFFSSFSITIGNLANFIYKQAEQRKACNNDRNRKNSAFTLP